jgi:hypothetical protein
MSGAGTTSSLDLLELAPDCWLVPATALQCGARHT